MPTLLILGASSDIGYSIAKKFAAEKYDIQLAGRNTEALKPLQSDLVIRTGVDCKLFDFDAMDPSAHQAFFDRLDPKPDVIAYVIGYMHENEKVLYDWNESYKTIQTNYTGAVSILNIAATYFAKRKAGTIIGISSVAGNRGRQSNFIYGSAKAGFTAYLSGLRNWSYHHNVHVMTVLPGFVYTKMTEHLTLPKALTAHPDEVGTAIYKGVTRKSNVLYVKWFWKWIMVIITSIPESMFKKKKL